MRIKSAQWGGSRTVGEGFEKSLRGGRRSFRCVSIESSEYRRDLRRKSTVKGAPKRGDVPLRTTVLKQMAGDNAGGDGGGGGVVSVLDDMVRKVGQFEGDAEFGNSSDHGSSATFALAILFKYYRHLRRRYRSPISSVSKWKHNTIGTINL